MNTKWIDDLWYFLNKDYGTRIVYTKIGKAEINYNTGAREDKKTSLDVPAIFAPVSLYQQYLEKELGRTDRASSRFLIRKSDLNVEVEATDYIVHTDKRYNQLHFDDLFTLYCVSGVATTNALPYRVLNLTTTDQLGLGDGL